ncbi:nucleoside 2-deoxyribosyltransferase [Candidatus Uhrbacteria bacterium]|nr:nucleoside 2-deoxyribosyltransferase [Candidatus Uhrbacteria bacterium]
MIESGIQNVYLLENAHIEFDRDRVYAQTLRPSVKSAYIAGAYTNNQGLDDDKVVHESLGRVCEEFDYESIIPFRDNPENKKPREERDTRAIYEWTEDQIKRCDVLIADVSNPSLGAGGELALARMFEKPIVLVSKKDSVISNFALGNPAIVYHIKYETTEEVCRMLKNVLKQL